MLRNVVMFVQQPFPNITSAVPHLFLKLHMGPILIINLILKNAGDKATRLRKMKPFY